VAQPISFEFRERAENLFILGGLTLEEVAGETGISIQALKGWSQEEAWTAQRKEYQKALREIERKTVDLKLKLTNKAIDTQDPQIIHAWKAVKIKEFKKENRIAEIDRPRLFLENTQFIAERLKERDPKAFKFFARNIEGIIKDFKAHAQAT